MSQNSSPGEGSSKAGASRFAGEDEEQSPFAPPPAYMTVGSGSTSASATALMTSLNNDSGYGGSVAGDSSADLDGSAAWRAGLLEDRPTPLHTPTRTGEWNPAGKRTSLPSANFAGFPSANGRNSAGSAEHEKQIVANHVHQLL